MLISLVRTVVMYVAILISVRLMGKRQISQLQTSELVVTLLISELAVMPIQQHDDPLWNGLIPMLVLVICEIVVSLLMLKCGKFRQIVCGNPMIVIQNGKNGVGFRVIAASHGQPLDKIILTANGFWFITFDILPALVLQHLLRGFIGFAAEYRAEDIH